MVEIGSVWKQKVIGSKEYVFATVIKNYKDEAFVKVGDEVVCFAPYIIEPLRGKPAKIIEIITKKQVELEYENGSNQSALLKDCIPVTPLLKELI